MCNGTGRDEFSDYNLESLGWASGRPRVARLRRAVGILISSGPDWTNRTKRLAARAPGLDIFSQALVLRDDTGWQITDAGRAFLTSIETPMPIVAGDGQAPEAIVPLTPAPAAFGSGRFSAAPLNRQQQSVPELTRSIDVKLNTRLSLRGHLDPIASSHRT